MKLYKNADDVHVSTLLFDEFFTASQLGFSDDLFPDGLFVGENGKVFELKKYLPKSYTERDVFEFLARNTFKLLGVDKEDGTKHVYTVHHFQYNAISPVVVGSISSTAQLPLGSDPTVTDVAFIVDFDKLKNLRT